MQPTHFVKTVILTSALFFYYLPYTHAQSWAIETTSDGSNPSGIDETSYVLLGDKMYLLGGRGNLRIEEYNPQTSSWKQKDGQLNNLNHFQAVALDNLIYIVCAFTGGYPEETPVANVYIYDPATDIVSTGHEIPANRRRGSAGTVAYNNKIYVVGGITNGHTSGHVAWFDEYDPATGTWNAMPDAPRARDHFNAAVHGNKLYVLSGRRSSYPNTFNYTVPEVDIYDFSTGTWSTGPENIPTERAGTAVVTFQNEILVIGGESMAHLEAHKETEALNTNTLQWRTLPQLVTARHGTQAVVYNDKVYIASGVSNRGGNPKVNTQEILTNVVTGNLYRHSNSRLGVFPNPCHDHITISGNTASENLIIKIYDLSGRLCLESSLQDNLLTFGNSIPGGFYMARVYTHSGEVLGTFSFTKQ